MPHEAFSSMTSVFNKTANGFVVPGGCFAVPAVSVVPEIESVLGQSF